MAEPNECWVTHGWDFKLEKKVNYPSEVFLLLLLFYVLLAGSSEKLLGGFLEKMRPGIKS